MHMTEMMICDKPIPFHLMFSISDYYNDYNDYHYDEFNSWLATMMNDLSYHNLIVKDATELVEVIGSKWSYALKWCKPNNDELMMMN